MVSMPEDQIHELCDSTILMLHELRIRIHRVGYKQLTIAVPRFALDDTQSLTKELYPYVATYFGYPDWRSVERSIRFAILDAWEHRDPDVWEKYFPNQKKPPSNKQFIATLAECLR